MSQAGAGKAARWPLATALLTFWALTALLLMASLRVTAGTFAYALDDAYIHLAIAHNWAQFGVWGVSPHAFASASSSILWILVVAACDRLFLLLSLPALYAPMVLNVVFGSGVLALVDTMMKRYAAHLSPCVRAVVLLAVVLSAPMPPLVLVGMEHLLHALLCLAFALSASRVLSANNEPHRRSDFWLAALAPLLTAARYEGLFLVFVVILALLWRRRVGLAAVTGAGAVLPIAVYGYFSLQQGWYFFPNPVLLKGHLIEGKSWLAIVGFVTHGPKTLLLQAPVLAALLGVSIWLAVTMARSEKSDARRLPFGFLCLFIAVSLLHAQFAAFGWFYRYEAYLMVWGIVAVALAAGSAAPEKSPPGRPAPIVMVCCVLLSALVARGGVAMRDTPLATGNVYQQQMQMATFVKLYYPESAVAVNDIGYISYATDARCVDLWGLSSIEVARARRAGKYRARDVARIAHEQKARLALVYTDWFSVVPPPQEWKLAGRWKISNNIVCADASLDIYATSAAELPTLKRHLQEFAPQMPTEVQQSGDYVVKTAPSPGETLPR